MIIVLKPQSTKQMVDNFVDSLQKNYDVKVNEWVGTQSTVLGLIGDTSAIDIDYISAQDIVESIKRVQEPYKKANRKFHPDDTVITLPGGQKIGDGSLSLIAGLLYQLPVQSENSGHAAFHALRGLLHGLSPEGGSSLLHDLFEAGLEQGPRLLGQGADGAVQHRL